MFTEKYLSDKGLHGQVMTWDQLAPQKDERGNAFVNPTGVKYHENGDVTIRVYAPNAKEVTGIFVCARATGNFVKGEDGVYEYTYPYNRSQTGPVTVNLYVDGALVLSPYLPVYWTENRPCNYIEVPDPDCEFAEIRDVPHGTLSRELFYSRHTGDYERAYVYTPAGYMKDTETTYPVLYLLNGGSDNETSWEYSGRMSQILDNLVADGKAVPFIVVMCNGMLRAGGVVGGPVDLTFENMLVEDVIPYIEKNYRAKTDKWNRAIAGLSMGAYMTCDISWHHPELFGSVGYFTASMTHVNFGVTYVRPFKTEPKKYTPEKFAETFRLYFRSTTPQEDHLEFYEADDAIYQYYGFDKLPCYHRVLYDNYVSKWNSWRMGLRDFAQLVFQNN